MLWANDDERWNWKLLFRNWTSYVADVEEKNVSDRVSISLLSPMPEEWVAKNGELEKKRTKSLILAETFVYTTFIFQKNGGKKSGWERKECFAFVTWVTDDSRMVRLFWKWNFFPAQFVVTNIAQGKKNATVKNFFYSRVTKTISCFFFLLCKLKFSGNVFQIFPLEEIVNEKTLLMVDLRWREIENTSLSLRCVFARLNILLLDCKWIEFIEDSKARVNWKWKILLGGGETIKLHSSPKCSVGVELCLDVKGYEETNYRVLELCPDVSDPEYSDKTESV